MLLLLLLLQVVVRWYGCLRVLLGVVVVVVVRWYGCLRVLRLQRLLQPLILLVRLLSLDHWVW